jgi:hypothetical protein
LRNGSDHNHINEDPAQLAQFGKLQTIRPTVTAKPSRPLVTMAHSGYAVETIRGDKQTVETFQ